MEESYKDVTEEVAEEVTEEVEDVVNMFHYLLSRSIPCKHSIKNHILPLLALSLKYLQIHTLSIVIECPQSYVNLEDNLHKMKRVVCDLLRYAKHIRDREIHMYNHSDWHLR